MASLEGSGDSAEEAAIGAPAARTSKQPHLWLPSPAGGTASLPQSSTLPIHEPGLLYHEPIPVKIKSMEQEDFVSQLTVKLQLIQRASTAASAATNPGNQVLRIELTDELDPFFYYSSEVDENEFQVVRNEQRLLIDFQTFPSQLIKLLAACRPPSKSGAAAACGTTTLRDNGSAFSSERYASGSDNPTPSALNSLSAGSTGHYFGHGPSTPSTCASSGSGGAGTGLGPGEGGHSACDALGQPLVITGSSISSPPSASPAPPRLVAVLTSSSPAAAESHFSSVNRFDRPFPAFFASEHAGQGRIYSSAAAGAAAVRLHATPTTPVAGTEIAASPSSSDGLPLVGGIGSPQASCLSNHRFSGVASDATLSLVETNQFKELTHLFLRFRKGGDDAVKRHLAYRVVIFKSFTNQLTNSLLVTERARESAQREVGELRSQLRRGAEEHNNNRDTQAAESRRQLADLRESHVAELARLQQTMTTEKLATQERTTREIAELKRSLQEAEKRGEELGRQVDSQRLSSDEQQSKLTEACSELRDKRREAADLLEENRVLKAGQAENQTAITGLKVKVEGLQEQLTGKDNVLSSNEKVIDSLNAQNAALEDALSQLKEHVGDLEETKREAIQEIEKGNSLITRLQAQLKSLKGKLKGKTTECRSHEQRLDDLQLRTKSLEQQLEQEEAKTQIASERHSELRDEVDSLKAQLRSTQTELVAAKELAQKLNRELTTRQLEVYMAKYPVVRSSQASSKATGALTTTAAASSSASSNLTGASSSTAFSGIASSAMSAPPPPPAFGVSASSFITAAIQQQQQHRLQQQQQRLHEQQQQKQPLQPQASGGAQGGASGDAGSRAVPGSCASPSSGAMPSLLQSRAPSNSPEGNREKRSVQDSWAAASAAVEKSSPESLEGREKAALGRTGEEKKKVGCAFSSEKEGEGRAAVAAQKPADSFPSQLYGVDLNFFSAERLARREGEAAKDPRSSQPPEGIAARGRMAGGTPMTNQDRSASTIQAAWPSSNSIPNGTASTLAPESSRLNAPQQAGGEGWGSGAFRELLGAEGFAITGATPSPFRTMQRPSPLTAATGLSTIFSAPGKAVPHVESQASVANRATEGVMLARPADSSRGQTSEERDENEFQQDGTVRQQFQPVASGGGKGSLATEFGLASRSSAVAGNPKATSICGDDSTRSAFGGAAAKQKQFVVPQQQQPFAAPPFGASSLRGHSSDLFSRPVKYNPPTATRQAAAVGSLSEASAPSFNSNIMQ